MNLPTARRLERLYLLCLIILPIVGSSGFARSSQRGKQPLRPQQNNFRTVQPPPPTASVSSAVTMEENDNKKPSFAWTRPTLELAIPALVATIADPLLASYDTANIGRLGGNGLAAVGVCTSIFYMSFYSFLATKTATTTLVASAKNEKEADLVTSTSLQMGLAAGMLVMGVLRVFGPQCLLAMGLTLDSEAYPQALTYLSTRCLSAPFFLLITVGEGALRGYGDTKSPLVASLLTAATMVALEPLLMFTLSWEIKGAAAAMALSQVVGSMVYAFFLKRRQSDFAAKQAADKKTSSSSESSLTKSQIIVSILKANFSMIIKQGSLLFCWANATKCATQLGTAHVAAHQVALSFWMVFAYVLDAVSVPAQVLLSKACSTTSKPQIRSVASYMLKIATVQGLIITLLLAGLSPYVPAWFTQDAGVVAQLQTILPVLTMQQVLISLTFVMEALAAGGSQFHLLGIGTALSSFAAVVLMRQATSIKEIWTGGVLVMFAGRLLGAAIGVINVTSQNGWFSKLRQPKAKTV